jgi:hypothetical protein
MLSPQQNPSKSPFAKGDFRIPPLEKGGRGIFDKRNQFIGVKTDLAPWAENESRQLSGHPGTTTP